MSLTVEAVYENGVLKLAQPLPFPEHEKVQVTVQALAQPAASPPADAERMVRQSYGLIGWTGDPAVVERIALDPLEDL
jgi:predicted DNA-binding antitoxin AbrB/MazE fold protein